MVGKRCDVSGMEESCGTVTIVCMTMGLCEEVSVKTWVVSCYVGRYCVEDSYGEGCDVGFCGVILLC